MRVETRIDSRIVRFNLDTPVAVLSSALRGRATLKLKLACSTACLSSSLGPIGSSVRGASGSIAWIVYERSDDSERLCLEQIGSCLSSRKGMLRLEAGLGVDEKILEKCLLSGAKLVAEQLKKLMAEGVVLGESGILDYASAVASAIGNRLVARLVKEARIETGCVEEIVSGLILERLEPLVAAAMVTRDVLERSVVAYPLSPTALAPAKSGEALGDYGAGLAAVLARHASEASVIASRLARTSIRVDPVYFNGYAGIRVEVEGIELKDPYDAPIASLALSLAASILERRSIILVVDGPLERLDEGVLQRELERVNAIVLHLKF
jgi:hypothetical protein